MGASEASQTPLDKSEGANAFSDEEREILISREVSWHWAAAEAA